MAKLPIVCGTGIIIASDCTMCSFYLYLDFFFQDQLIEETWHIDLEKEKLLLSWLHIVLFSESDLDSDFECGSRSKRKSLDGGLKLLNAEYQRDYRQQRKAKKSEEQLQRERELNKLRQRRYRNQRLSRACIVHLVIKKNNWSYVKTMSCSGSHLEITINIKNTKFVKDLPMIDAQFRFNQCNSFTEEYISVFSPYGPVLIL